MDPVLALRQIAYYKDRAREDPRRVMAYRNAADIVEALSEAERDRHGAANSWQSLPGIGPKTAKVIAQAWADREPEVLVELRSNAKDLGGGDVRAALRGDLHVHSNWSDGSAPIEEMMLAARDLGHEYCALTDHSPRLRVANGLSPERLRKQLDVIDELRETGGADAHPHRHRGRHSRRRLAGSGTRTAGAARRRGGQRALQTLDGRRIDDAPNDQGGHQPSRRCARPLHGPPRHRRPRRPAGVEVRRREGVHRVPRQRHRRGDQLPARAPRPADPAAEPRARTSAACSPSTPIRTHRGSWSSSATAPSARWTRGCRSSGSSTPGPPTSYWTGRRHSHRAVEGCTQGRGLRAHNRQPFTAPQSAHRGERVMFCQ